MLSVASSGGKLQCEPKAWSAYAEAKCVAAQQEPAKPFWEQTTTDPVAAFTGVLALLTFALVAASVFQGFLIGRQIKLAREEFNATHRAKLRVRNIVVSHTDGDDIYSRLRLLRNGSILDGQFYISNVGSTPATNVVAHLIFFSSKTPLPMKRPYEGNNPNVPVFPDRIVPGTSATVLFQTVLVPGHLGSAAERYINSQDMHFDPDLTPTYAMGWVEYRDAANTLRRTAFCRLYDPRSRRFTVARKPDPDYEHEE